MKKRLLSLALCLALCLGLLPPTAWATEGETTPTENSSEVIPAAKIGDQSYPTLPEALEAAQDGETVTLLADHETDWDAVNNVDDPDESTLAIVTKNLTLDLRSYTVDYLIVGDMTYDEGTQTITSTHPGNLTVVSTSGGTTGKINALDFINGTLEIQSGQIGYSGGSGLTCNGDSGRVTISGGTVLGLTVGEGATVTVSGGSQHAGTWYNYSTLNITGGKFGNVGFRNNGGTIAISGGTFGAIQNFDASDENSYIPPMSLLAPGYAFYAQYDEAVKDGSRNDYLTNVTVKEHTHTIENGKCACGASCTHGGTNGFDYNSKTCPDCGAPAVAQTALTDVEGNPWRNFADLQTALDAKRDGGSTLRLLTDVSGEYIIDGTQTTGLDLNGHSINGTVEVNAVAEGTKYTTTFSNAKSSGSIKEVLAHRGANLAGSGFPAIIDTLTIADTTMWQNILKEPDCVGFKVRNEDGTYKWYASSEFKDAELNNVTIESLPITSNTLYLKVDGNNVSTVGRGTTVQLCAYCNTSGAAVTFTIEGGTTPIQLTGNQVDYKKVGSTWYYIAEYTFEEIGSYQIGFSATKDGYSVNSEKKTLNVTKASIPTDQITAPTAKALTYNGQPQELVNPGELEAKYGTIQYSMSRTKGFSIEIPTKTDVGTYRVYYKIVGNDNYNNTTPKSLNVTIAPKALTITGTEIAEKTYDGTTAAEITGVTFDGLQNDETLTLGKDYTVSGTFDNANAGSNKTVTVSVELNDSVKNYTLPTGTFEQKDCQIKKATITSSAPVELTITNGVTKEYFIALPSLPDLGEGKTYGEVSYNSTPTVNLSAGYTAYGTLVSDSYDDPVIKLLLRVTQTGDQTGSIGTVTIPVTTSNYKNITLTVNVSAKNKIVPTGKPTVTGELTYGDTLSAITLSGSLKDGTKDVPGIFTWTTPSAVPNAGSYDAGWKFVPTDNETYAETTGTATIHVNEAQLNNVSVEQDGTLTYNSTEQSAAVKTTATTVDGSPVTFGYSTEKLGSFHNTTVPAFTNAGTYTVYYEASAQNHKAVASSFTVTISPKRLNDPTIELSDDFTYTGEEIKPEVTVKDGNTTIDPKEYEVSYKDNTNAGTATVTITDKPGGNYIVNGSIEFTIAKAALTDVSVKQSEALTYNGEAQTAKVTTAATAKGNQAVTFTYSTEESDTYGEMPAFTDAGTYTVYYKASAANHETASGSFQVVIGQAPVTVKASDKSAYVGGTAPDLSKPELNKDYTVSGLFGEDILKTAPKLSYVKTPDMSKVGEAEIKIEGAEVGSNYKLEYQNGKLNITTRPSSGGSDNTGTKTDTVKNPDGSTTKTETKSDGSKTETTTATTPGGSTGSTVTKTDAKGNSQTEASAKLSDKDVKDAQEKGEAVTVPVKDIEAAKGSNSATEIKIDVPKNSGKTTVEIPVDNVTSGTVAVIVHPDGTEEIAKSSKPTDDGVQLEINGSTTVKIIDNSKDFIDTRDHWSRDEVNFVAARELFNGVGDNRFGVSQPMTRGMVNTVLARLSGVDTTPGQGQTWYEIGTEWAKKNGISDGTNPTGNVTREQLATLLYRYAGSPDVSGSLGFADANSVSDYAKNALLWANQNGIVSGVGNNTIAPKANAQRAQVAAMFARYLKNL